jgi:mono/diheme cytochrome c family protein
MPGFGAVLSEQDIELIIEYLRGMGPDAWNNALSLVS